MGPMIGLLVVLAFILLCGFIVYSATNVDRPQRIGRRDAKVVLAENKALRALVNDLDVEARAEHSVTNSIFANHVSNKIAQSRKELP